VDIARGGTIGAAEAYMQGKWETDDLTRVIRVLVRNVDVMDGMERGTASLMGIVQRLYHRLHENSRRGARLNIAAHYDLGNEFFSQFLDETMMY
jgi:cyclopropane-fatty-acyl-phospholipid synthase